eukprot:11579837-Alexandrium_andersonii.AAC.1
MVHLSAAAARGPSGAAVAGRLASAAFGLFSARPAWPRGCSFASSAPLPEVHRRSTRTGSLTR